MPQQSAVATDDTQYNGKGRTDEKTTEIVQQEIIKILERLLKQRPLTGDARFIDLTSDIRKAFIFIREFQRRFAFDLPLSAFFDAPTIADLAHIAVTGQTPPLSRLVLLRRGDEDAAPLFLVPGLGGVVFELLELSKQIVYAGPIYAFAAPGLDGIDPPSVSTQIVGRENFNLAQQLYPTGPYRFLGHSSGGVSAFEMTRYAVHRGAQVDFFGVLDTNFAERAWPAGIWFRHMLRRAGRKTSPAPTDQKPTSSHTGISGREQKGRGYLAKISGIGDRLWRVWQRLEHRFITDPSSQAFLKADPYYIPNLPPKFQRVRDAAILTAACYRPTYYDGDMYLFQAEFGDVLACNPVLTWSRLVRKIILRPTPGDHMTMLIPPHVAAVAAEVSTCLSDIEHTHRESAASTNMREQCDRSDNDQAPQSQADRY